MTRTTLNIDTPVLQQIKTIQREGRKSLGQVVSELLTEALARRQKGKPEPISFTWISKPMNPRVDIADKEALYAELDRGESS